MATGAVGLVVTTGLRLDFTLPPRRWVDLDTLVEATMRGLRDAGVLQPRYAGLDAVMATKAEGPATGVAVAALTARAVTAEAPPGQPELTLRSRLLPRPGNRAVKAAWRDELAAAWGSRAALAGALWADVEMPVTGSLIAPLEVVLDALEPVLGRDPRGRSWQAFFPNDHLIEWLRVRRCPDDQGLGLRLGTV